MMAHLLGKKAKQIRDKRKEPSYKALVEQHHALQQELQRTVRQDVEKSDVVARLCESEPGGKVPALGSGTPPAKSPQIERIPQPEGLAGAECSRNLGRTVSDDGRPGQADPLDCVRDQKGPSCPNSPVGATSIVGDDDSHTTLPEVAADGERDTS